MKKVIRLNENDIEKLVKKILQEESKPNQKLKVPCTEIAKRKHQSFPSVKATGDIVECMKGKIWGEEIKKLKK